MAKTKQVLTKEQAELPVVQVDPRTGERQPLDPAQPGKRLRLKAPQGRDCAFVIGKKKQAPAPAKPPAPK